MSILFFLKPSTIKIDFFTSNVMAYNMAKIMPAKNFIPGWWKQIPMSYGDHPYIRKGTLKKCSGFIDLYKSGFIIPMWCDLAIDIGPIGTTDYRYQYSDYYSSADEHNSTQRGMFFKPEEYQHLKLLSPWFGLCKKDIKWVFTDVIWDSVTPPPYRVLTGVVDYKFNHSTNINIMFPREEKEKQILISYKTPLAHLIPMTERKIKFFHHLVEDKELTKIRAATNMGIKFFNKHAAYKSELKCPINHN